MLGLGNENTKMELYLFVKEAISIFLRNCKIVAIEFIMNTQNTGAPTSGPRYDYTGNLLPHSVLGKVEDYAMLSGQAEEVVYKLSSLVNCFHICYITANPKEDIICGMVILIA